MHCPPTTHHSTLILEEEAAQEAEPTLSVSLLFCPHSTCPHTAPAHTQHLPTHSTHHGTLIQEEETGHGLHLVPARHVGCRVILIQHVAAGGHEWARGRRAVSGGVSMQFAGAQAMAESGWDVCAAPDTMNPFAVSDAHPLPPRVLSLLS
jgi:hypothetical protein